MTGETIPMFENLQIDNPGGRSVEAEPANDLQKHLLELMEEHKVSLADIQRGTGIHMPTLYSWYRGQKQAQLANHNLLKLAQFFGVTVDYLCFGIGEKLN